MEAVCVVKANAFWQGAFYFKRHITFAPIYNEPRRSELLSTLKSREAPTKNEERNGEKHEVGYF